MPAPLKTFIIYARADEGFKKQLLLHLRTLRSISVWHDGDIKAGEDWDAAIKRELKTSELVLYLVSVDSINSKYIQSTELETALERHQQGQARIVPIVVAPCPWKFDPIVSGLQALPDHPTEGVKPVRSWTDQDEAWTGVVERLSEMVDYIQQQRTAAEENTERERREAKARAEREQAEALAAEQESERQREAERRRQREAERQRRDHEAFFAAATAGTAAAFDEYLRAFPAGAHAHEARQRRKAALRRERAKVPATFFSGKNIAAGLGLLVLAIVGVIYFGKKDDPESNHMAAATTPAQADNKMALIKGGTFQMGSADGSSDEKPVHTVTVRDFYLGRTEVTAAEFKAFIEAKGYQADAEKEGWSYAWNGKEWAKMNGVNWRDDAEGNRRPTSEYNHPVIHVSWNDAKAYCAWLSEKENKTYRLPTEAEWEYAAGNGAKHHKYSWGNGDPAGKKGGNVADESAAAKFNWAKTADNIFIGYNDGFAATAPVGSFDANELGLHDMSGNVWEWCEDWYHDSYQGAPTDGSAWLSPAGSYRVGRGGSCYNTPAGARVAGRGRWGPAYRNSRVGFRLARTL